MAGLQQRGGRFRILFRYHGKQFSLNVGEVSLVEAEANANQVDYLLLRLKQGLVVLPAGIGIVDFLAHDGRPPAQVPGGASVHSGSAATTLGHLRDRYLKAQRGALEANTLATAKIHLNHIVATLGEKYPLRGLSASELQRHIDRRKTTTTKRGRPLSAATIRKEIAGLRAAWNWARNMGLATGDFPARGLVYPKADEPPPFMTRAEIERVPTAERDDLWDVLYLTKDEVAGLLSHVRDHAFHGWIFPMVCTAAHIGARRSELIRMRVSDVDFASGTVLVREKKRSKGRRTTRRVPLSTELAAVLKTWLGSHPGGSYLFCHGPEVDHSTKRSRTTGHRNGPGRPTTKVGRMATVTERTDRPGAGPLTVGEAHDHFKRTLAGSAWQVVRGWHVLRHSFISACAAEGVDQRMIDEWVGHTTEAMRRQYRHLCPSVQRTALTSVFG
jgi:integrase